MISADVSCRILEVDFSGIEAVITGRCLKRHGFSSEGAKQYIRLARLGMHAAVTGLKVGKPVDLSQDDKIVKEQLNAIKKAYVKEYDTSKRTVHANNFGMTVYGMQEKFPEFFPTIKAAEEFQKYYYALAPDLPKWHLALRKQAREAGFLGGQTQPPAPPSMWDHEYGYRHWFHDVLNYKPITEFTARKWLKDPSRAWRVVYMHGRPFKADLGGDGNRVIAFYPQSIAAGRLKEAENDLFMPWSPYYIGDAYFGRTPLLGPIHDSLLLHIPVRIWDKVVEIVAQVMQRPSTYLPIPVEWGWGEYLPIGVAAKAGRNWAPAVDEDEQIKIKIKYGKDVALNHNGMEDIEIPAWVPHAGPDDPVLPHEDGESWFGTSIADEEESWNALQRHVA